MGKQPVFSEVKEKRDGRMRAARGQKVEKGMMEKNINKKEVKMSKVRDIAHVKTARWEQWNRDLGEPKKNDKLFSIAKQMKRERQNVLGGKYTKNCKGDIKV